MDFKIFYGIETGIQKEKCDDSALLGTNVINAQRGFCHFGGDIKICISDGVGGNEGGKEASLFLMNRVKEIKGDMNAGTLKEQLLTVNEQLLQYARSVAGRKTMAATFSGLFFQGNHVLLAHCGNTRVYALQGNFLKQLTEDQTTYQWLMMTGNRQAAKECNKCEIRGAFGGGSDRFIDTLVVEEIFERGIPNTILLTSDGIHDALNVDEMEDIAASNPDPAAKVDKLISRAVEKGSRDDCTAVLVQIAG